MSTKINLYISQLKLVFISLSQRRFARTSTLVVIATKQTTVKRFLFFRLGHQHERIFQNSSGSRRNLNLSVVWPSHVSSPEYEYV